MAINKVFSAYKYGYNVLYLMSKVVARFHVQE
jgi:hypothetical protein